MRISSPRAWLDNPILIKHVRSRLRRQPLAAAIVVVLVLCLSIAWGAYELDAFQNGGAFGVLLGLQAIILVIMGATQVGSSAGAARASGILDFHRVSPLSSTDLTLGFFFGAPIREYVLFACTLPFAIVFLASGTPRVRTFIQLTVLLIACAWLFHGLSLLNALVAKARGNPRGVVGLLIFVILFGGNIIISLTRSVLSLYIDQRLPFYGMSLPWLAVVLSHMGAVLYFVFLAARRKIGSPRIHALSKPQSIGALATLAFLLVGSIWRRQGYAALEIATVYTLVTTANLLILMVTPDQAEYEKGLWRASRQGRSHLPWWDDLSLNRVFLVIACATVLATASFVSSNEPESSTSGSLSYTGSLPLAIAVGVLVVAYFGLADQYFALRFASRGMIYFTLFLFLSWLVPIVAGSIVLIAAMSGSSDAEKYSQVIFSLSPLAGIGLTAVANGPGSFVAGVQAAAITPALLFAFCFNSLLISARRRLFHAFVASRTGGPLP